MMKDLKFAMEDLLFHKYHDDLLPQERKNPLNMTNFASGSGVDIPNRGEPLDLLQGQGVLPQQRSAQRGEQ